MEGPAPGRAEELPVNLAQLLPEVPEELLPPLPDPPLGAGERVQAGVLLVPQLEEGQGLHHGLVMLPPIHQAEDPRRVPLVLEPQGRQGNRAAGALQFAFATLLMFVVIFRYSYLLSAHLTKIGWPS